MHRSGPFLSPMLNARLSHLSFSGPAGNDPQGGGSGEQQTGGTPPRTFLQEDVTRVAAAEKAQGERAGRAAALRDLGLDGVDPAEARRLLDAARARDEAALTQAQRDAAEADRNKREAAADRQLAARERADATRLRLLTASGAQSPGDVVRMLSDVPVDATEAETTTAIAALKDRIPALFVATNQQRDGAHGDPGPGPASGNGGGTPPAGSSGAGSTARWGAAGRAAAQALKPQQQQTG